MFHVAHLPPRLRRFVCSKHAAMRTDVPLQTDEAHDVERARVVPRRFCDLFLLWRQ